jgi:hypothetical protein
MHSVQLTSAPVVNGVVCAMAAVLDPGTVASPLAAVLATLDRT